MDLYDFFFGGSKEGVLPDVDLLSRWRWSGLPVEVAILFGPGFSAIVYFFLFIVNVFKCKT